jgi:hypothetical protein
LLKRWRVALAEAGITETEWAIHHGVTQSHVGQVVKGGRDSARLTEVILAFIEDQERNLAKRLANSSAA